MVVSLVTRFFRLVVPSKLVNIALVISKLMSSTSLEILKFVLFMFLAVSSLRSSILMFFIGVCESKINASVFLYFNPTLRPILLATSIIEFCELGPSPLNICKLGALPNIYKPPSIICFVIGLFVSFPRSLLNFKFFSNIYSCLTRAKLGFITDLFSFTKE